MFQVGGYDLPIVASGEGRGMKTASLPHLSELSSSRGIAGLLQAAFEAARWAIREQAAVLPAIGLAENGDVEGASQLLARSRPKS